VFFGYKLFNKRFIVTPVLTQYFCQSLNCRRKSIRKRNQKPTRLQFLSY